MRNLVLVLALSLAGACGSTRGADGPRGPADKAAQNQVHAFDAAHAKGPISLADWTPAEGLFAVGTLSDGRGEVTIDDGEIWITLPPDLASRQPSIVRTERVSESRELCGTLVVAHVDDWIELQISQDVPWAELGHQIESLASAVGIDVGQPFPVRIYGGFRDVTWHVDPTLRPATDVEGAMVGFYSRQSEAILSRDGGPLHLHLIWPSHSLDISGHVVQTGLKAGSTIGLPKPAGR